MRRLIILFLPLLSLLNCFEKKGGVVTWTREITPTTKDLYDIFIISLDEGWACGEDGTLLHFFEGEWAQLALETFKDFDLFTLFFLSTNEGWMGGGKGNEGVIFQYNGTSWSQSYESTGGPITSIHFSSPTDGWAVGRDSIYHFDGSSWNGVWGAPPYVLSLSSVFSFSPKSVWAIGEGSSYQFLIHFDGVTWSYDTIPTSLGLHSLYFTTEEEGWMVGDGGVIFKLEEGELSPIQSPKSADFYDVYFLTRTEGWIVGMDEDGEGTSIHLISSLPFVEDDGIDEGRLYAVYFLSPSEGWVVGEKGRIFRSYRE